MANFILLLAIICAAASFVLFTADGTGWVNDMCSTARSLCHSPQQVAYAAVGLAGLWIVLRIVSAVRD
jgi:hypothetical protein